MSEAEAEFQRIAELSSLAPPEGAAKARTFQAARKVLGRYSLEVVRLAEGQNTNPSSGSGAAATSCPLRSDEPRDGLADGVPFELAPEAGNRLIRVPRVL